MFLFWRKGQDSNLRGVNLPVFKTGAFNHSATLPCFIIAQVIEVGNFSDEVLRLWRAREFPDGMTEDGFEFLWGAAARIAEIDFVMIAGIFDVESAVVVGDELVHGRDSCWLVVITAEVKTLNDQAFVISQKLNFGKILFLLLRGFFNSPVKIGARDKIGQANGGNKVHVGFTTIVERIGAVLPPKTFERRNNIFKKS